MRTRYRQMWR